MKQITTVAGVIQNKDGKILCTLRDAGKYEYVSYKWEFPGGKIEEGETKKETLSRELMEELEMKVQIGELFYQVEHDYPDFHLSMTLYRCKYNGEALKMNVHKGLKWLDAKEMLALDWADADKPVAQEIYNQFYQHQF